MANVQVAGRALLDFDPVRWSWRLLTSVRFALGLIGFLTFVALIGVLVPQLPFQMRDNPAAINAWLALQEERFGLLTDPMYRLGIFDIFRSFWFISGLFLLVASVCVCTANRLPPIWRNVRQPQNRVPDEYFERSQPVTAVAVPDTGALTRELQRRHYRVEMTQEEGTTYLFADRYPWAQFATFVSHLALILFLAGGFVTVVAAREQQIFIAEQGNGAPIFAPTDPDHMQVYVVDAVGRFDKEGFPLDYRTHLIVYQGGAKVAEGVTTVNDPLDYGGYRFYQSAYFPDGAALSVRNLESGRVVYDEVLALTSEAITPRIVVRDPSGAELLNDVIVPTDFIADVAGTTITVPGTDRQLWVGARPGSVDEGWQLVVFDPEDLAASELDTLRPGQTRDFDDLKLTFLGMTTIPSTTVRNLPGADAEVVTELSEGPAGPLLTVGPIGGSALALSPGEPVEVNGYEYSFDGQREYAGITVRRDPGSALIWIATGLFLLGLTLTFYTPRRRLWGKIRSGEAAFRGLGGRAKAMESDIRQAARAAALAEPLGDE